MLETVLLNSYLKIHQNIYQNYFIKTSIFFILFRNFVNN